MNTYLRLRDYLAASETAVSYVIEKRPDADVLDLSLGQVAGSDELVLIDAAHPQELTWSARYPSPRGDPTLIAEYLRYFQDCTSITEPDDGLRADNVLVTQGGKHGLWLAFALLVWPGSRVLIPVPGWMPYRVWAEALGATALPYAPSDTGYEAASRVARSGGADVMVVCSPNNPTGHELSGSALAALLDSLDACSVSTIVDDVYESLSAHRHPLGARVLTAESPLVIVDSLSKSLGVASLRIGFLIGIPSIVSRALRLHSLTLSGVSSASQAIATQALSDSLKTLQVTVRASVEHRRRLLLSALNAWKLPVASSGAMYVWLSPGEHLTGDVVTTPRCQLRGVPGSLFGAPGFLRLCATSVRTASLKNALGETA